MSTLLEPRAKSTAIVPVVVAALLGALLLLFLLAPVAGLLASDVREIRRHRSHSERERLGRHTRRAVTLQAMLAVEHEASFHEARIVERRYGDVARAPLYGFAKSDPEQPVRGPQHPRLALPALLLERARLIAQQAGTTFTPRVSHGSDSTPSGGECRQSSNPSPGRRGGRATAPAGAQRPGP